jgi:selenocysteine-specific elongation factor
VLGYKPDIDNDEKACRIAFFGSIQIIFDEKDERELKLYKEKVKKGSVDRVVDSYSVIVKDLFNKETNLQGFIGKEVWIDKCNLVGKIDAGFGNSGKVKVAFKESIEGRIIEGAEVTLKYVKWYQ